jgi:nucleotide-binding universal stress UspA family protein
VLPTTILLASDGSEEAARAARTAIELSEKLGAELHHVPDVHMLDTTLIPQSAAGSRRSYVRYTRLRPTILPLPAYPPTTRKALCLRW